NKPIPDVPVVFSTSGGTLSKAVDTTRSSDDPVSGIKLGQAQTILTVPSGTAAGTITVTGTVPGRGPSAVGTVTVTIT
ncbi:MAG TPA: hypothetical protein VKK81_10435, partial [Candidatus Binatia bacterium]|nr:hypothetical protein [Candidatus Binatia bacterium]